MSSDTIGKSDKSERRKKNKQRFFESHIIKLLKEISPINGITSNAKQQLNSILCILSKRISEISINLVYQEKKKTITEKDICCAVKIIFSEEFGQNLISEANDAVQRYSDVVINETEQAGDTKRTRGSSRQNKANIIFPPSVMEKFIRNFGMYNILVSKTAPVFFAKIIEGVANDILLIASELSTKVRLTIRELELAVRKNIHLDTLFTSQHMSFLGGGVVPFIHESLTKKKRVLKKVEKKDDGETKENTHESFFKKPHRFRPGTVSIREIKKYQKTSNCLILAKLPFEKLVREIIGNLTTDIKVSKDVFIVLQYYMEQFMVDFLRDSNNAAIHCGRVKLLPSDITFINSLRKYPEIKIREEGGEVTESGEVAESTELGESTEINQEDVA